jgi:hypothetical protein
MEDETCRRDRRRSRAADVAWKGTLSELGTVTRGSRRVLGHDRDRRRGGLPIEFGDTPHRRAEEACA